jgi:hypothetical protein
MTTWNAAEFLNATDVMARGGRYYARTDLDRIKDTIATARSVQ